jgi:pimeloyl-ACP methyl ester carboxylesterase
LSSPGYRPLYPRDSVARCRRSLERDADLAQYGTDAAVADLDAVRAALGYDRIDLFGISYGTLVELRYLAAHPDRVRAAVLVSVAPPSSMPPRYHAEAAERGLRALFDRCAADPACGAAFRPEADIRRALARLPTVKGAPSREIFMEKLRTLMYQPTTAFQIPYIVHRAAAGNLAPFIKLTRAGPGGLHYYDGMLLSVTCSESFGLFDYRTAAAAARKTRFGDYRLRRQYDACAVWPKASVRPDFLAPVRAKTPVLIVSGLIDPVTPFAWAATEAGNLTNSRHVLIPAMGHVFDGLDHIECFDSMVLRFLDTGDPDGVDTRCVATMTAPPFRTRD